VECTVHKLVVDVALIASDNVLLVRYRDTSRYDNQQGWFLPDDYLDHLEHPDDGAKRILLEQVGLEPLEIQLAAIESFGNGAWHLVFHYRGQLEKIPALTPSENIAAARWFQLDALPEPAEVSHHGWALETIDKILATE